MALAVFPGRYAFEGSDAAVLLNDDGAVADHLVQTAMITVAVLERWAVLRTSTSGLYRMHDAHMKFAKESLVDRGDIRKQAVRRWSSQISRLEVAIDIDMHELLGLWSALSRVGGSDWEMSPPYDDHLVQMDSSNPLKFYAVAIVAELYLHVKSSSLFKLMERVVNGCRGRTAPETGVKMTALWYRSVGLGNMGLLAEQAEVRHQLAELIGDTPQLWVPDEGHYTQRSTIFNIYGYSAATAGRLEEGEKWFRRAKAAQEAGGLETNGQTALALHGLGHCLREAGRSAEAHSLFFRALTILKAKLGIGDLMITWTMQELGKCAMALGKPDQAAASLKMMLQIVEARLGVDNVNIAEGLVQLGGCLLPRGRWSEAERQFRWALQILESSLGRDDVQVAGMAWIIGACLGRSWGPKEAEGFFRRTLDIREAKLGPNDMSVAEALEGLGMCLQGCSLPERRFEEAAVYLMRALEIKEAKLGLDDVQVAEALMKLAGSLRGMGRRQRAASEP